MLARPGAKVAKGTPARSDAKVVKTCGGFQAPLMVFSDFYEKQMLEDPPVNSGNAPTPALEPDSEPEAETGQVEETPKEQTVTEVETYRMPQVPLPDELPRPGVPKKPSWWEIGWRRLMGRSVNDTIWDRWCPPEPSNYVGQVRPCGEPAGLGEVNDEELNRLDWELEKGFNEALQSEKDFMDGVRVGFLKNMTKLPFNLAGFVLNSREVQDMPDKLESSDVEDEGAYVGGKITADVVTTVLGIIGIVSGVGQMVTGLAGDVGGGALCASGVGIPAGVAVVAGSTTLVVAGAAEAAASASLVYSSVSNLGGDVDELNKAKEKVEKKTTLDYKNKIIEKNGKYYTDKETLDEIGKIVVENEDFSKLTKEFKSSRASSEGGLGKSSVYKYSDSKGTKYVIHEVTDANGNIIHRDFDAVRIPSGQLILKE